MVCSLPNRLSWQASEFQGSTCPVSNSWDYKCITTPSFLDVSSGVELGCLLLTRKALYQLSHCLFFVCLFRFLFLRQGFSIVAFTVLELDTVAQVSLKLIQFILAAFQALGLKVCVLPTWLSLHPAAGEGTTTALKAYKSW